MKKLLPALIVSIAGALIAYTIAAELKRRREFQAAGRTRYGADFDAYQNASY